PGVGASRVEENLMCVAEVTERRHRAPLPTRSRVEVIDEDPIEPRLEARSALEGVSKSKGAKGCLLNEVLGVLLITREAKGESIRRLEHVDEQRFRSEEHTSELQS